MPKVICDQGERPLVVYSEITGPIRQLSFLRRSLLFAELSMVSYNDEREARQAAEAIGFTDVDFFDNDGSQAYRFANEFDCVIASRGTEPNEWNDIQADANAATVLAETAGRVHRGFKKEVDDVWPMLEQVLKSNRKPIWFCGHSLGGAMATITAGRCFLSHIASNPEELYTFGSPRVGDRRYVNYVKLTHYRWVNNNDIVTRVPPRWMGYRHRGHEIYLDYQGRIRMLEGWLRTKDRLRGFLRGLRKLNIDHFSDHSIRRYIDAILHAIAAEEGGKPFDSAGTEMPTPHLLDKQPTRV
ncbi:MAG: lipase family protein [Pirellulaceae bacterium]